MISRDDVDYVSHFCEENNYMLAKRIISEFGSNSNNIFVVFISNISNMTPIWCQKLSNDGNAVYWDYHVILIVKADDDPQLTSVYDLDTALPFPTSGRRYIDDAIRINTKISKAYEQYFRVIDAETFIKYFASDRSHMWDGKKYYAPVPPWPLIRGSLASSSHNLHEFICMTENKPNRGAILNRTSMYQWLCSSTIDYNEYKISVDVDGMK